MPVFSTRAFSKHEQVVFCSDPHSGLRAIIAVHSTVLGPAVGGCRFYDYGQAHRYAPSDVANRRAEEDAIFDVLRLSRGMSYKNAMARLRLGGGKSVIIGDPKQLKSARLLRSFGSYIDRLGGNYYTAEDMGTSPRDMAEIHNATDYVVGLEEGEFATGDPSPHTAKGVFYGIKAAVKHKLGQDDLEGLTVAVQGVGHVGGPLCDHLRKSGAAIIIADVNEDNIRRVRDTGPATVVDPNGIHAAEADVFSPCARGAILNSKSIPEVKAKIIAGAANNQLDQETDDDKLVHERGILYAPDYVINAGGIISVESEVHKEPLKEDDRHKKVAGIADTLMEVFQQAEKENRPTGVVANDIAERRIEDKRVMRAEAAE